MFRRTLLAGLALPAFARAQADYPSRPVRMIVPFAAGGSADVVARITALGMQEALGQPVVVENRGGSGGVIGSEAALAAAPDGYTFVFHTLSSAVLNAGLYRNLSFDVRRAFAPLALIGTLPNIIMVNPRVPAGSLPELIALMKSRPGRITYASSGAGTITHLSAQLLATMAGAEATHVPYRGSGPAFADLLAGTVDMMVDTMASVIPAVRSGQVRALAVTTLERSPALPEVPTAQEAGLPGYETYNWHAVFAPAAMPAPLRARLEAAGIAAVRSGAARLTAAGVEPRGDGAAALAAFWDKQFALWIPIIRASGATAD
ncbi:MFS transporter [Siccirubricoccus deserti]|uniref:Tripartite tricarboxylate transporter substrate binding protein n=1 Tax=Siccirubricoccus deserti TaxID=2013562 RepID=A0A9X0UBH1_9PROT|nr:tripartite tricarboxylate transporter substrate binding protein [Siccirubricoccus deserti]MBC4013977.1 tripartite tricarboxylate transporter substrate binding protein [Siccirubricoccus deserti]GGC31069.1 MFS transporter [Siccirubricoccus deserti]